MNVDATLSAACRAQLRLVQSMRSANVRAESIVFNRDALSAFARNRPPLWKPVRQMPREMQRWGVPPTTVSYCELQTLRRILALAPSAERPGRHGRSLAAVDELWPALPTKVVKLYGSYAAYSTSVSVRRHALSHATRARLGHEPHSVCEFA